MLKKHRSLENTDCSDEKSTAISSWWWSRRSRSNQVGPVTMSPAVSFTSTSARLDSRSLKGLGAKPVKAARGKGSSTLQVPNQIRGIDLDKTVRLISVRPLQTPKQINLLPRSPTIGAEKNYDSESAKGKVISRSIQRTNLTISTLARNAFADSSYVTTPTTMTSFIDTFDNGKTGESEPSNHFTEEKHSNRHKGKQAVGPNSYLDEKPSNTPSKICLEEESSNLIQYIEEKAVPSKDCLFGEPAAPNHCSKTAGTSQAVLSLDDVTDVETAENGRAEKDQEDDFAVTARTDADPSSQEKVMEEIRTARNGNRVHWERESTRSSEKYNDIETPGIAVTQSFKAAAKRDTRSFRLALLLLLVTAIFVISWIPPYVAMVWYFYVGYTPPLSATDIAVQTYAPTGYILNSFVNPFLYVALSPAFRNTVISLWRKFSRCGRGQG
ncbi:hypothetical protein BaRGS_00026357 [Batillaria attramentaria]|uniref:G-protein coupled receptors family 1 profile domain-containing protein n=1 Tax=Batillaria attramentaria TaxID=370345 RepID=A0ABD0K4U9_9CAEN